MQEFNGEGTVTIANLGVVIDSKIIHISDDAVININEDGTILFTGQVIYNQEMYQGDVLMDSVSTTLDHDDSGTWTLDGDGKIITDVFGEAFTFRGDDLTMSQELDENYLNLGEDGAELGFEFDQTLTMKYSKK